MSTSLGAMMVITRICGMALEGFGTITCCAPHFFVAVIAWVLPRANALVGAAVLARARGNPPSRRPQ